MIAARAWAIALAVAVLSGAGAARGAAQEFSDLDRDHGLMMVRAVGRLLRQHYYDPTFRGIDLEARLRAAEDQIRAARSNTDVFLSIARVTLALNDSHTLYFPPQRAARVDYGWAMRAIGDSVYVTAVYAGTPAASRGLRIGDRLLSLNGFAVTRDVVWQMRYFFDLVSPQSQLDVVVEHLNGAQERMELPARVVAERQFRDLTTGGFDQFIEDYLRRYQERRDWEEKVGSDVLVWRLSSFEREDKDLDRTLDRARACKGLVLDLRGNGGGFLSAIEHLVSRLFERPVLISVDHKRNDVDSITARPRDPYTGTLVVVVDGASASASEILARVVQLERRGVVIGDRTAGAVMGSRGFSEFTIGGFRSVLFGMSVTVMDVRMSDGASLEQLGVMPDERLLPTARDLATRRDPVLSRAVALAGATISPEAAGALLPVGPN